jgi:type IV pilus assembly protein PilX
MEQQLIFRQRRASNPNAQRGYSLAMSIVFALILSLVAAAVARKSLTSSDATMGITFRQATANGADRGMLMAANWLNINAAATIADSPANGFYATELKNIDWTGLATPNSAADDVDWDGTNGAAPIKANQAATTDSAGNRYAYVIQRLCGTAGAFTATSCVQCMTYIKTNGPSDYRSGLLYNVSSISATPQIYYRVTVRTVGPKGTVSYSQALVLISA